MSMMREHMRVAHCGRQVYPLDLRRRLRRHDRISAHVMGYPQDSVWGIGDFSHSMWRALAPDYAGAESSVSVARNVE